MTKLHIRSEERIIEQPRFVLTGAGKKQFPKLANAGGVIIRESNDGERWTVLFDHLKSGHDFHKSFIRMLPKQ